MNMLIQDDLFAPRATNVGSSATNAMTPAASVPTLVDYATKVAKTLWPKDHTRKSSLRACVWFTDFGDHSKLTLATISRKHIYDFVEHLVEDRGQSQNTANKYQAAISRVLRHANEREVVDNPVKLKYAPIKSGRPRYFTDQEEADIVSYLRELGKGWMADMVTLSCNSGMRKGEILAISDKRVTLSDDGLWLFLPKEVTKTNEDREVPLNAKAQAAYHRLMEQQPGGFRAVDQYSHRIFYRAWNKVVRDVGKGDVHFVFHVCRHTAATRLANDAKVNSFLIGDILGHKNERTTRRYVHMKAQTALDAVSAI